ncbi:MAG: hypothetical protein RLW61_20465 [Gammaproteobacteria bacterium]
MSPSTLPRPARSRARLYLPLLGLVLLVGVMAGARAAGGDVTALSGHWTLDEDASDDPEDVFDGKLRRRGLSLDTPLSRTPTGERPTIADKSQENYWRSVAEKDERRAMRNLRRLGTVYPLITSTALDISTAEGGLTVVYDGELPRFVRPNPAGRVFSASGDELVADTLGYTLAYWDAGDLVLETDPPDGGKYIERLHLAAGGERIEYHVKVRGRMLTEPVELMRAFTRADAAR